MKNRMNRPVKAGIAVVLIISLAVFLGELMYHTTTDSRKREADLLLHFSAENIMLRFKGELNEAETLAKTAKAMRGGERAWFESAAESLLEREEVSYVCLIEGDTMVSALPKSVFGDQVGRELKQFSYIFTMAKVVKELVIEGPVIMEGAENRQEVFLFLEPFLDGNTYLGEVVVALDRDFVLDQFDLEDLSEKGYDYELWRVDPQNGGKEVVAVSRKNLDFSHGVKTSFYLPTQWNLSLQPVNGWVSPIHRAGIVLLSLMAATLMLTLARVSYLLIGQNRILKQMDTTDCQTGLLNRTGFAAALDRMMEEEAYPISLFYFVFEGYDRISQMIDPVEHNDFLRGISGRLREYIRSPYAAGRVGAGHFIIAVSEPMSENQQEDFSRGLSLELLMKIRIDGEKRFLTARCQYRSCRTEGSCAETEIGLLIKAYYDRRFQESPAHMLTEKCRQLIEGREAVAFDEYSDPEMTELSKAFNQYRKQVEQLAYFDPAFHVGNRSKYLRDANMLISYDKKRHFSLFCVDIRRFSQYNQLFSTDVGDEILQNVVLRLSRPFGNYLYRINGDVFLGISLSGENEKTVAARLEKVISSPVSAGNTSFVPGVRIAVCRYPEDGDRPEVLLDRIQSTLRYAKESNQDIVEYGQELDTLIRTETNILHQLKSEIRRETMEVWYQPMMCAESGRFTSAEALVRLPDGKDGYFSAGQAISLAERSGLVEQLGDFVLRKACDFMFSQGESLGLEHMGVNLSVQQLLVGNSADHLLEIIRAAGVDPERITLEITESTLIQSMKHTSAVLDQLRQTGIRIALDDFGVGYSSLNYLSNLSVDVVKIDRALTQQICTNPKQRALVRAIVEMAEINSLTVVAEGVETEEEQELIAALGVRYIQGFYSAPPMRQEELIRFLSERRS